ncbi:hypothetical protein HG531_003636 [Fusarium graminearum]|nr:hypothetical protein HG531_003636 [Fusarium graminearum]
MSIKHIPARNLARLDQIHHARQTLALVYRIRDERLSRSSKPHGFECCLVRDTVHLGVVVGVEDHVVGCDVVLAETNLCRRVLGDAQDLVEWLLAVALELVLELGEGCFVLDAECRRVESHVAAHESRELDVADLFIARVFPVNPVLLDCGGFETEL